MNIMAYPSIRDISREAWNACFPDALEDYDYMRALEDSQIQGFQFRYYTATNGSQLVAIIPAFLTVYQLDTTMQGIARTLLGGVKRMLPSLLSLKMACLGSIETEHCPIGFHPSCENPAETFTQLLQFFLSESRKNGYGLMSVKDVSPHDKARFDNIISAAGLKCIESLPSARMDINFTSIEDYLAKLSRNTRKDMRRKLKRLDEIVVEHRHNVDDLLPEIMAMYHQTKNRSDWQFEELTPDYFQQVLSQMGPRALCTVYRVGGTPVAINLMLLDKTRLLDKFFCMRTDIGHEYSLYFLSWFTNLGLCLEKGLTTYQSGQASYTDKLRLGSTLDLNWNYFRHANRFLNKALQLLAPLLAVDLPEVSHAE